MKLEKTILEKQHDELWYDQAKRSEATLNDILDAGTPEEIKKREANLIPVAEELTGEHILQKNGDRTMSRILFVTRDVAFLEKNSMSIRTLLPLANFFDEMHIMVLVPLRDFQKPKRIVGNVWVYGVTAQLWWMLPFAAVTKAKEQLVFNGSFRPDLIVALDPFESGLAAYNISREFHRPFQVHIFQNFYKDSYTKQEKGNVWRRKIADYVLKRAQSVRVSTQALRDTLKQKYTSVSDISILPQFHNFKMLIDAKPSFDVHEKYSDFVFTILAFGPLTSDSHLHDTFSALNDVLHNPKIGLIIIGDGPAKKLFEEKVELLGVKKNVIFLSSTNDLTSYLKTADVLIQTDVSNEGEEIVFKAAAAGLPMIMYETDTRVDLFEDGVSATLCAVGDVHTLAQYVAAFLNNTGLRMQYKAAAQDVVKTRLQEDEVTYYRSFRDSIELAFGSVNKTEDNGKT